MKERTLKEIMDKCAELGIRAHKPMTGDQLLIKGLGQLKSNVILSLKTWHFYGRTQDDNYFSSRDDKAKLLNCPWFQELLHFFCVLEPK